MKEKIHPEYYEVTVTCACGNSWRTRSTHKELRVEICSACHPFFTGRQKLIDSAGRVERFQRRYQAPSEVNTQRLAKKAAKKKVREAALAEARHKLAPKAKPEPKPKTEGQAKTEGRPKGGSRRAPEKPKSKAEVASEAKDQSKTPAGGRQAAKA